MTRFVVATAVAAAAVGLSGCGTADNFPLIFGQSQTVGIGVSGSTTDQGGEITVGYKDRNIAIIPVTVRQKDGNSTQIMGRSQVNGSEYQDSLSVFGQFEVGVGRSSTGGAQPTGPGQISLGKFFATGQAAMNISDGFKQYLSGRGGQESAGPQQPGSENPPVNRPASASVRQGHSPELAATPPMPPTEATTKVAE